MLALAVRTPFPCVWHYQMSSEIIDITNCELYVELLQGLVESVISKLPFTILPFSGFDRHGNPAAERDDS